MRARQLCGGDERMVDGNVVGVHAAGTLLSAKQPKKFAGSFG
jgi:hypothetical protein